LETTHPLNKADEIRKQQREYWNAISPGWKKWDTHIMHWFHPIGEKLLEQADLQNGDQVLDVATGSGEPGLSAAKRVGNGRVIGADSSEDMLSIAREKAKNLGVRNYETRLLESSTLPFESNYFDAVTCRFGVMFFPDMLSGVREMVRVLKPQRRLAVSVWGPQDKRRAVTAQTLIKLFDLPRSPNAPTPYRCSERGSITSLLRDSGLRNIEETELSGQVKWDSPEQYWQYERETSPSIAFVIHNISEEALKKMEREILDALSTVKDAKGEITFDWIAWADSGTKMDQVS
jgi:ubiquinone/menaquinone biosynthesis C-methylase UbiE